MDTTGTQVPELVRRSIRLSLYESASSTILTTLAGGAFLTGFLLALGASNPQIGVVAALPALANLAQVFGSYLIARTGDKKRLCVGAVLLHRLTWLAIVLTPLYLFRSELAGIRVWLVIAGVGLASVFQSLAGVSWLSWMADLIPENLRGRFFSNRNAVGAVSAMLFSFLAGQFIDWWNGFRSDTVWQCQGFSVLFSAGLFFGLLGLSSLVRIPTPEKTRHVNASSFWSSLRSPLADRNFRRFILFSSYWGFAVMCHAPFFNVYLINQLRVPFSLIALMEISSGITGVLAMRVWGKLTDRVGNKPLLLICTLGSAFFPAFWLVEGPYAVHVIWFAYIVSGVAWAGLGVNFSGLLMRLAPLESNAVYFAVFSSITGIVTAVAPIVGGVFGKLVENTTLNLGIHIRGLQVLFGIGFILRLLAVPLLHRVQSPRDATVKEVILYLKRIGQPMLMMRTHRFNPIENMALFMSRGAAVLEGQVERLIEFSTMGTKRGWHMVIGARRRLARLMTRLEFILNTFADWILRRLGL